MRCLNSWMRCWLGSVAAGAVLAGFGLLVPPELKAITKTMMTATAIIAHVWAFFGSAPGGFCGAAGAGGAALLGIGVVAMAVPRYCCFANGSLAFPMAR